MLLEVKQSSSRPATPAAQAPVAKRAPDWPLLGALRFRPASVVVCNHYYFVAPFERHMPAALYVLRLLGGFASVMAFFIVSGYSIAASVERDVTLFYPRRFWRLAPTYVVCLLYSLIPIAMAGGHPKTFAHDPILLPHPLLPGVLSAALFVPMMFGQVWTTFGQTWSLTCEVVYYSIAPILKRTSTIRLAAIGLLSVLVYIATNRFDYPTTPTGVVAPALFWLWLAGFVAYRKRREAATYAALAIVGLMALLLNPHPAEQLGPITCAVTVFVFWAAMRVKSGARPAALMNWLGDVSYPLYISHITTMILLYQIRPHWFATHSCLYYLVALAVAALLLHLVDLPARRYSRRRIASAAVAPEAVNLKKAAA